MKRIGVLGGLLLLFALLAAGCGKKTDAESVSTNRGEEISSVVFTQESEEQESSPSSEVHGESLPETADSSAEASESEVPATESEEPSTENPTETAGTEPMESTDPGKSGESAEATRSPRRPRPAVAHTTTSSDDSNQDTSTEVPPMTETSTEAPSSGGESTQAPSPGAETEPPNTEPADTKPAKSEPESGEETEPIATSSAEESETGESGETEASPSSEETQTPPDSSVQIPEEDALAGVDYSAYLPVPDWVSRGSVSGALAMQYGGYYTKNAGEKVIYITFCMDYENGYTYEMLDLLANQGIGAAFFITGTYLSNRPDMARAIMNRGHVLGSHSYRHIYTSEQSDVELINDFVLTKKLFADTLGYSLQYYRPAYGFITERDMYLAQKFGFTTVMFSFYYRDYDLGNQPSKGEALGRLISGLQPGAVYYLHVTPCNIQALPEFAAYARSLGYTFLRLDQNSAAAPATPSEPVTEPPTEPPMTRPGTTPETTEPGEEPEETAETQEPDTEPVTEPIADSPGETEEAAEDEPVTSEAEEGEVGEDSREESTESLPEEESEAREEETGTE